MAKVEIDGYLHELLITERFGEAPIDALTEVIWDEMLTLCGGNIDKMPQEDPEYVLYIELVDGSRIMVTPEVKIVAVVRDWEPE